MAAVDLYELVGMNASTSVFYAGMNGRIAASASAAVEAEEQALDAEIFSAGMAGLLHKAKGLEALVNRLDEYTSQQETTLSRKQRCKSHPVHQQT